MFGYVAGRRNFVSAGRVGGEVTFVVPHQLLGRQPAHALNKTAFDLADVDGRVDAASHVMQDVNLEYTALAREGVDGDFSAGCAIGKVVEGPAAQGGFVVVDFGCAVKAVAP